METIKEAAVEFEPGRIFTGHRHHNCYAAAHEAGYEWKRTCEPDEGFMTESGKFVSREEAAKIALAAGQIEKLSYDSERLFSEDLY